MSAHVLPYLGGWRGSAGFGVVEPPVSGEDLLGAGAGFEGCFVVGIEEGLAGEQAGFVDDAFAKAGATVVAAEEIWSNTDVLIKVRPPSRGEVEKARRGDYKSELYRAFTYKARGRYLEQLERYWAHFPRESLLVLRAEDLFGDPAATVRRVLDFLGLDGPPADNGEEKAGGRWARA